MSLKGSLNKGIGGRFLILSHFRELSFFGPCGPGFLYKISICVTEQFKVIMSSCKCTCSTIKDITYTLNIYMIYKCMYVHINITFKL